MELEDKLKFGKEVEDLPLFDLHTYESRPNINGAYEIVPSDQGKTLVFYDPATITIPDGLENENITKPISGLNTSPPNNPETDVLTIVAAVGAGLVVPHGFLPKVKVGGRFQLNLWYNTIFLTGDLVEDSVQAGPRPEKRITNTTQYTAIAEDATKYLVFDNPVEFIIPSGVFAKDDELEGDCEGGDVTVTGSGVTLLKLETQRAIILNNGPFGMRFKSGTKATLMGALKPL